MRRKFSGDHLVLASHNAGKLIEIKALLEPLGIRVTSAAEHGLAEPAETEDSFAGNARLKARFAATHTNLPALSDDSGIEVEALNDQPGVYTADWAETPHGRDFTQAMTRVWTMLEAQNAPFPRKASFVCTLCIAWPDGHSEIFEGRAKGHLTWPMRGDHGFGFDPIFIPDGHKITYAEMLPEQKHRISHRAQAFEKLVKNGLSS